MAKELNKLPNDARLVVRVPGSKSSEYLVKAEDAQRSLPSSPNGTTDTLYQAIENGICTIAFAGTSITKGRNAQMEEENTWVEEFKRQMVAKYPAVNFDFMNFGLDSRNIAMLADPAFVGLASDPGDGTGYYETTTTTTWEVPSELGVSWQNHIKNQNPDVVVLGFGMNWNGSADDYEAYYQTVIDRFKSSKKVPTLVLVTEMLPTLDSDPYLDRNGQKKLLNERLRTLAKTNNCLLIDVERNWQILRDGKDPLNTQKRFVALDTMVLAAGNVADTLTFNSIDETTNSSIYEINTDEARVVNVNCEYTPKSISSNLSLGVRFNRNPNNEVWSNGIAVQIRDTDVKIYNNGATVQTDVHALITATNSHDVEIDVSLDTITVSIDSTVVSTYTIVDKFDHGNLAFGVLDALAANVNLVVSDYMPVITTAKYTSNELVGNKTTTEWNNGDKADGGNAINHPSRIGLSEAYYPAIDSLISTLKV